MLNRFWEKNVTVLQSSFIAEKTLDYRQEIIRGPIMMIFWFVFAALKLYCMLGVSAQSTRLHISVHKYLFSFESGYFSVFKNIIVVPFCLKTSIFFICTGYPWIVLKLFLPYSEKKKKKTVLLTNFVSPEHFFRDTFWNFRLKPFRAPQQKITIQVNNIMYLSKHISSRAFLLILEAWYELNWD